MSQNKYNPQESPEVLKDTGVNDTKRLEENVVPPTEENQPTNINSETAITDPQNATSTTNTMEVHHHAHTPRHKWTHYFWEFFMLFLAVTAGFMAENLREHYIEHHRAKQYAAFLYEDLRDDTANLQNRTRFMSVGSKALDTLMTLLQSFKDEEAAAVKIYSLSAYVYSGVFFSPTTSTLEQLKNSGSLRYFPSNDLIRYFSQYDTDLQRLKAVEDRNVYLNEQIRMFLAKFLDLKNIPHITFNTENTSGFQVSQPAGAGQQALYKRSREQLNQYANLCALKQLDWNTRMGLQNRLLASARNLMVSLKKEYDLK